MSSGGFLCKLVGINSYLQLELKEIDVAIKGKFLQA